MLTNPNGENSDNFDKVMLLGMWASALLSENKPIYSMGMGKPTYPVNVRSAETAAYYWLEVAIKARLAALSLSFFQAMSCCLPENQCFFSQLEDCLRCLSPVVAYGNPQGELLPRTKMAEALSVWYGVNIQPGHVLFTVGGSSGIRISCEAVNKISTTGKILTTAPYYTLYKDAITRTGELVGVPIMSSRQWTLTAKSLEITIQKTYQKDNRYPIALVFCDPNNPLGTMLDREELLKIAAVLDKYPSIVVILDEAYAEMRLNRERLSLFSLASDTLRERIILLRSATKALSASGERMAVAVTLSSSLMARLVAEHVSVNGHAPISLQMPFAEAMHSLSTTPVHPMIDYYERKVRLVEQRLGQMGVAISEMHQTTATFYVIANLKDFIGTPFSRAAYRAIKKQENNGLIESDEEIAYHLLFEYGLMVAPLSYFGVSNQLGYVRITCSLSDADLTKAMDLLETAVMAARAHHVNRLYKSVFPSDTPSTNIAARSSKDTADDILHILRTIEISQKEQVFKSTFNNKDPKKVLSNFFFATSTKCQRTNTQTTCHSL